MEVLIYSSANVKDVSFSNFYYVVPDYDLYIVLVPDLYTYIFR